MGQEPFFKHKPSSSEISPPSPPQVNLKSSNAFQILQSDVSEVVAPIEFADQCISPAISPRLTEVDTHGKTQFLPSPASSHTDCMQASLSASCPSTTYACKCPLPSFTSQTKLISSPVSYISKQGMRLILLLGESNFFPLFYCFHM